MAGEREREKWYRNENIRKSLLCIFQNGKNWSLFPVPRTQEKGGSPSTFTYYCTVHFSILGKILSLTSQNDYFIEN